MPCISQEHIPGLENRWLRGYHRYEVMLLAYCNITLRVARSSVSNYIQQYLCTAAVIDKISRSHIWPIPQIHKPEPFWPPPPPPSIPGEPPENNPQERQVVQTLPCHQRPSFFSGNAHAMLQLTHAQHPFPMDMDALGSGDIHILMDIRSPGHER